MATTVHIQAVLSRDTRHGAPRPTHRLVYVGGQLVTGVWRGRA